MKRMQLLMLFVVAYVICLEAANNTNKKKDVADRKRDRFKSPNRNPCVNDEQDAPLHCFCDGAGTPGNVTSAECWVFTKELTHDYAIWNYFASQPHITVMKIFIRPHGQLTFVPTKGLRYLKDLQNFQITYGAIDEVHPFAFANLTQLKEIKLSKNQIMNLSEFAFAHLSNLTELNLDENRISELCRDVFVDLPNLQKLFITQNNLSILQEGTFRHLAHLLELELYRNYINVLTKDTFAGLGELKRLDLSSNKISMLGALTFAELWVLEVRTLFALIFYTLVRIYDRQ